MAFDTRVYLHRFFVASLQAINMTQAFPVAAGFYSILRAGVRFFGYALPGQCTNAVLNLTFSTGQCVPASTWLITRVSQNTSAHAWSWVMYGGFALAVAFWKRPSGNFNGWRAFMLVGFTIAVHELIWFATYFVMNPEPADVLFNLLIYGAFIEAMIVGIGVMIALKWTFNFWPFDTKILLIGLGVIGLYFAGWASIGYPLTLDLKIGVTQYFASGSVDFLEFCSWLIAFAVVGFAYYAKMIKQ